MKERLGQPAGSGPWEHMMAKDFGTFTYEAWRRTLAVRPCRASRPATLSTTLSTRPAYVCIFAMSSNAFNGPWGVQYEWCMSPPMKIPLHLVLRILLGHVTGWQDRVQERYSGRGLHC